LQKAFLIFSNILSLQFANLFKVSFLRESYGLLFFLTLAILVVGITTFFRIRLINKFISIKKKGFYFKIGLRILALAFIYLAWKGPHIADKTEKSNLIVEKKDILFVLDLSHSMLCDDVKPSRLDRAKIALKGVTEKLKGSNFGLVVFTKRAMLQCPLTYDQKFIHSMVDFVDPKYIMEQGTDFKPALELSLRHLLKNNELENRSKVIVLISDGEDFGTEMNEVSDEIKKQEIRIYCIGVGTSEGGTINIDGELKRDADRNVVRTKLNASALNKLANITNGKYYELSNTQNDTQNLIVELQNIKGQKRTVQEKSAPKITYYHYFALIACLLLLLDFFIKPKTL
jgi:Ca-activated chloride channel homolog